MAYVSVLMPAYNSGRFIGAAIDSVLSQSFRDWELIIIDDASTDNTGDIAKKYSLRDNRIKYYRNDINSGSANQPRLRAASIASGSFITSLDSDDFFEEFFLEKIVETQRENNSDIVTSIMVVLDKEMNEVFRIPKKHFDESLILTGKEACGKTIGKWELSLAGGLIAINIYKSILFRSAFQEMHADEINSRLLLLKASKVAFSNAVYYCRQNPESITRKPSKSNLSKIETSFQLLQIVEDNFGVKSDEYFDQYSECSSMISYNYLFVRKYSQLFSHDIKLEADSKTRYYFYQLRTKVKPAKRLPIRIRLLLISWISFVAIMRLLILKRKCC